MYGVVDEDNLPNDSRLTTPLFELLSVTIYPNDVDGELEPEPEPSQVYGTIHVIDGRGALFDLYNRPKNDVETVSKGGRLTLTHRENCGIHSLYQVQLKIDIKDKVRKASIAHGLLSWDYRIKDDYDQVRTEYVDGQCGRAAVQYVTYRHAILARMEITLLKGSSGDSNSTGADVYGKIVASCGNICSTILFETTQDQPVWMGYGYQAGRFESLFRSVMTISAHSSLIIDVDLWNCDTHKQICCKEILKPFVDWGKNNGMIDFAVAWLEPYLQTHPKIVLKHEVEEASSKKPRLMPCAQQRLQSFGVDSRDVIQPISEALGKLSIRIGGDQLLEVFSVLIVSDNGESFNLWGTIKAGNGSADSLIFDKEKRDAVKLLSNQTVPIRAPNCCFNGLNLDIKLKLLDSENRIISKGNVYWGRRMLQDTKMQDRPLCSVIRGDIGYAAVHYAIFDFGVQATVKVFLESESKKCFQVHGSVFSEYSRNFNYVTPYEKKHYRNVLFQKHSENSQLLSSPSFEVPLSKYVVGVPLNSGLIVDLHLMITTDFPQIEAAQTFQGRLSFRTTDWACTTEGRIRGNRQNDIVVSISWNDVPCDSVCSNLPVERN